MLVDLSHVGAKTTEDAIRHSAMPVAFTHCCPIAFLDHTPGTRPTAEMRLIAERGGFVGVATYTPFLPWHDETTVDQCAEVFEHVIDVAGEDHVGLGTDFTEGQDVAFFEWLGRDKGIGRNLMAGTKRVPPGPKGLETLADYPNLTDAMLRRGWSPRRVEKIMGGTGTASSARSGPAPDPPSPSRSGSPPHGREGPHKRAVAAGCGKTAR